MREALRGYAAALLEPLAAEEAVAVAHELGGFEQLVLGAAELAAALTDDALPVELRLAVLGELMTDAGDVTRRLVQFALRNDHAGELLADLTYLALRAGDEPARRQGAPATDPAGGHTTTNERLEGFAVALLEDRPDAIVDAVEEELFRVGRTLEANRDLSKVLGDPDLPATLRVGIVEDLLRGRSEPATARILAYAVREARSQLLEHVEWLVDRVGEERGRRTATVTAAVALDDGQRSRLADALGRLTGRKVSIDDQVDAGLVGGLRVVVGDIVIDGTLRRRLNEVRSALAAGRTGERPA